MDIQEIRKIHNLEKKDVEWAVIKEETPTKVTYKPGLKIKNSSLYLDLLARRLFSAADLPEIKRKVYAAEKIDNGEMVAFVAKDDTGVQVVLPSSFLTDVYLPAWYDQSLEGRLLL